jgi:hypothetical protein
MRRLQRTVTPEPPFCSCGGPKTRQSPSAGRLTPSYAGEASPCDDRLDIVLLGKPRPDSRRAIALEGDESRWGSGGRTVSRPKNDSIKRCVSAKIQSMPRRMRAESRSPKTRLGQARGRYWKSHALRGREHRREVPSRQTPGCLRRRHDCTRRTSPHTQRGTPGRTTPLPRLKVGLFGKRSNVLT